MKTQARKDQLVMVRMSRELYERIYRQAQVRDCSMAELIRCCCKKNLPK